MKISVTLPSLDRDCLQRTLENLNDTTLEHELDVIVASPFEVEDITLSRGHVTWIEDIQMSGCVHAHWLAAQAATGEFITSFADDHSYALGWDVMAVDNFVRRERLFRSEFYERDPVALPGPGPFSLGLRQISDTPHVGTMFGIYYPYFPLMRLREARAVGGWYDASRYCNGFSDPDLGMRVWAGGGRCEWADQQTITPRPEDRARRGSPDYLEDATVFLLVWAERYGAGWDLEWVRGWDLDVPVSEFPPDARTCFRDESIRRFARTADA